MKTYEVWVRGHLTDEHLAAMRAGVLTPIGMLKAASVQRAGGAGPKTRLVVELDEGRNRHIRRMFGALRDPERGTPLKVLELKRTAIGPLQLDVESGQWRMLTSAEDAWLTGNSHNTNVQDGKREHEGRRSSSGRARRP
jgi:23S rRNA pseudouridine2605 synthase